MALPAPATVKHIVHCPANCSLRPDAIGPGLTDILIQLRENGAGYVSMSKRIAELLGRPVPKTNMQRHLTHFREIEVEQGPVEKLTDLEALKRIIDAGVANQRNWKPTLRDTMDAIKLKMQITGNSAFEDLVSAMNSGLEDNAAEDEVPAPPEDVEALPEPAF